MPAFINSSGTERSAAGWFEAWLLGVPVGPPMFVFLPSAFVEVFIIFLSNTSVRKCEIKLEIECIQ